MEVETKFQRCEPDDPNRCQGSMELGGGGQCPFKAVTGSTMCARHGGLKQLKTNEEAAKRIYRLAKWQARVGEIADHDKVKSLREEIGISRVLLEEIVARCTDSTELLINSSKIADLVIRIEKLVTSCHRLEAATGMLLDKQAALHLASIIVGIISSHVVNSDALDTISNEIITAIITQTPATKEK